MNKFSSLHLSLLALLVLTDKAFSNEVVPYIPPQKNTCEESLSLVETVPQESTSTVSLVEKLPSAVLEIIAEKTALLDIDCFSSFAYTCQSIKKVADSPSSLLKKYILYRQNIYHF